LLHALAGAHDGDTADLALELDTGVGSTYWRGDLVPNYGKMVQAFLDQQPNDAVAVEDEVCSACLVIADHPINRVRRVIIYDERTVLR
jgi:hypothetical protein